MLRKLNVTLGIIALAGLLFVGAFYAYTHFNAIENSRIVKEFQGGLK